MVTSDYYNVLVSRFGDDCKLHEKKFMVSVDFFSSWLKDYISGLQDYNLKNCEVTIRDIQTLSFQCSSLPSWFMYGD